jgi:mRNA interferase MazF
MKRGDVVVVVFPGDYGKPRPAVVVQADRYATEFESVILCPLTTTITKEAAARVVVAPTSENGLESESSIMIEKLAGIPRKRVSRVIGQLDNETMRRVDFSLAVILGLT